MFKNYKSYLNLNDPDLLKYYRDSDNVPLKVEQLFNFKEFISKDMDSIEFYGAFLNTKIFKNFLIKNLYPITIEEKLEVLLLDENVRKKKNKYMFNQLFPEETPFLNSEIFKIKEGNA